MAGVPGIDRSASLTNNGEVWVGKFDAMASPCEILIAVDDRVLAKELLKIAATKPGESSKNSADIVRMVLFPVLTVVAASQLRLTMKLPGCWILPINVMILVMVCLT